MGFYAPEFLSVDQVRFDPVSPGPLAESLKRPELFLRVGDYDLSAVRDRDAVFPAEIPHEAVSLHAVPGLEGIGNIVDAGVENPAVSSAGVRPEGFFLLDHDDVFASASQKLVCDRETENPSPDDEKIAASVHKLPPSHGFSGTYDVNRVS